MKCEVGCKIFTGHETHHHPDCVYYPESMSKIYDDMKKALAAIKECESKGQARRIAIQALS